ncbi:hypothetical protein M3Y94_00327600 [Aphelenchoides besseyi]|nr:hypothetical protein M3Y94_00327600 [Aphelenchoides besseyi]KAI6235584.1 hypothetical protein M3Y95_00066900 [Aphelenchoides besseyi]
MCDNWNSIKQELGAIGPIDPNLALDDSVLRSWLNTLLTTTDATVRRRLETAVMKLPKVPDAVFPLCSLIMLDTSNDIRCYAATILSNEMSKLIATVLECSDSAEKLNALHMALMIGLSETSMPRNFRSLLLRAMGVFIDRTFPDIWPEALEQIVKPNHSPDYVFEILGNFAEAMTKSSPSYHVRCQKETVMWSQFSKLIAPFTLTTLESNSINTEIIEKIAYMISEWCKLTDPSMNLMRSIVSAIFRRGCFTFRSLTLIIVAFQQLGLQMTESRLFISALLNNNIHQMLLLAATNYAYNSHNVDVNYEDRGELIELLHVIFDFYASTVDLMLRQYAFVTETGAVLPKYTEMKNCVENILDFCVVICSLNSACIEFIDPVGRFFTRVRQDLDPCHLGWSARSLLLERGKDCFNSIVNNTSLPYSDDEFYEVVLESREAYTDLLPFLYSIAAEVVPDYYGLMQQFIQQNDTTRLSALLYYFNELDGFCFNLSPALVTALASANSLVYLEDFTNEQRIDFARNYFTFFRNVIAHSTGLDLSLFSGLMNTMGNIVSEPRCTECCLKLLLAYIKAASLNYNDCVLIQNLSLPFVRKSDMEIRNTAVACIANLLLCPDEKAKCESIMFLQSTCRNIIRESMKSEHTATEETSKELVQEIEIVGRYCNSISDVSKQDVLEPLREYLWELLVQLMSCKVPDLCIEPLLDSLVSVMNEEIYDDLSPRLPDLVHTYPHLVSRLLKDSLKKPIYLVQSSVLPRISDFICATCTLSLKSTEVTDGELAALELLFILFHRHATILDSYISTKSSHDSTNTFVNAAASLALKAILRGSADDAITRGLRVLEKLVTNENRSITMALECVAAHAVNAVLDLVRSFHFSAAQNSIATILYRLWLLYREIVRQEFQTHETIKDDNMKSLLNETISRVLILKRTLLYNMKWLKEREIL